MAKNRRQQMAEINVVPYIDVMLVLLIIFMITTPIVTQGVNVELPDVTAKAVNTEQEQPVVITVTAEGAYSVRDTGADQFVTVDEVVKHVVEWRRLHPGASVVIGGDKATPYGNVVVLMARLQTAGIENVGLLTQDFGATLDRKRSKK